MDSPVTLNLHRWSSSFFFFNHLKDLKWSLSIACSEGIVSVGFTVLRLLWVNSSQLCYKVTSATAKDYDSENDQLSLWFLVSFNSSCTPLLLPQLSRWRCDGSSNNSALLPNSSRPFARVKLRQAGGRGWVVCCPLVLWTLRMYHLTFKIVSIVN